ncbi:MAG: hypothetical protein WA979_05925 [Pacificimonas sp.]
MIENFYCCMRSEPEQSVLSWAVKGSSTVIDLDTGRPVGRFEAYCRLVSWNYDLWLEDEDGNILCGSVLLPQHFAGHI